MNEQLLRAEWAASVNDALVWLTNALEAETDSERDICLDSAQDALTHAGKMHMRLESMGAWKAQTEAA